jgi:hypothetical protein
MNDPLTASDYAIVIGITALAALIGGVQAMIAGALLSIVIVGVKKK